MKISYTLLKLIAIFAIIFVVNSSYAFTSIADDAFKAVTVLVKQLKNTKKLNLLDKSQQLLLRRIGANIDDYLPYINRLPLNDRLRILLAAAEQKDLVKVTEKIYLYRAILKGKISEIYLVNILKIEKMIKNNLSSEAIATIDLIKKGGPFLYKKDGTVFRNREYKLPIREDLNYYKEYTVETPGSLDRGARRIITGKNGEIYYTQDHYQTFKEIVQ